MHRADLDSLLANLSVNLEAVAVCDISWGMTLVFEPLQSIVVHQVVHGTGVLDVQGCTPISFGSGTMLLIPPDRSKRISATGSPSTAVVAAKHCSTRPDRLLHMDATGGAVPDVKIVCGTLQAICGSFGPFDHLSDPLVEDMSDIGAVRMAFQSMLVEQAHPGLGTRALIATLMKQCLLLLIRRTLSMRGASSLSIALCDERLARALRVIFERPGNLLRMSDLAASAGMSRSAFSKRFMEAMRTTPMEFVRQTRLRRAAELLECTDLPIKTIAREAGYASRSQFCRAFSAAFNTHPSKYRKRKLEGLTTADSPPTSRSIESAQG
jgi:AraC family transcriptional regulator, activator of mtrCDE